MGDEMLGSRFQDDELPEESQTTAAAQLPGPARRNTAGSVPGGGSMTNYRLPAVGGEAAMWPRRRLAPMT